MKHHLQTAKYNSVSIILLLGLILITACDLITSSTPLPAVERSDISVTSISTPGSSLVVKTHTPTPIPPSATPVLSPTQPLALTTPTQVTQVRPTEDINEIVLKTPKPKSTLTTPTKEPTVKPTPLAITESSSSISGIEVYETTITLPTYPFKDFLVEQIDPIYNIPVFYFDRSAYEAAGPSSAPVDYKGVVLENDYLRLTFLPELGGRLYSAVIKATEAQEIFYHNPVVKPSRYGVLQPAEANWWLATGGMEWAYPTQEHGYRWGVPWDYEVTQSAERAIITLRDIAPGRVGAEVRVTLPVDSPVFTVAPRLVNDTSQTVPIQFWVNAALSLAPGSMSLQTKFIVPVDRVIVHSRGEPGWSVPDAHSEITWPLVDQTDLSEYSQWANYLGVFAPNMPAPFIGAYNPEIDLGVVRLIEPGQVPGSKLFAFGADFPDRSYTDDGSQYFEIWGGANTGFWPEADVLLPAGKTLAWQEQWRPLAGLGGITWANQQVAMSLSRSGDGFTLSALFAHPEQGQLIVLDEETPILTESFAGSPVEPLQWDLTISNKPVRIRFVDEHETTLLDHQFYEDYQSDVE